MLAAFGRSLSMDRGVEEEQETSNLLHFDDEQKESTTLTEAAAVAPKLSPVWTSNFELYFNLGSLEGRDNLTH